MAEYVNPWGHNEPVQGPGLDPPLSDLFDLFKERGRTSMPPGGAMPDFFGSGKTPLPSTPISGTVTVPGASGVTTGASAVLPSTPIGTGMAETLPSASGIAGTTGAGMSTLDKILKGAEVFGDLAGSGASASAQGRRADALTEAQLIALNNRAIVDAAGHNLRAPGVLGRRGIGANALMNYTPRATEGPAAAFAQSLKDPAVREAILQRLLTESGEELRTGSYRVRPQQAQFRGASTLEQIGAGAGIAGGLAGGLREIGLFGGRR